MAASISALYGTARYDFSAYNTVFYSETSSHNDFFERTAFLDRVFDENNNHVDVLEYYAIYARDFVESIDLEDDFFGHQRKKSVRDFLAADFGRVLAETTPTSNDLFDRGDE